ncbi:MAG: RICIN domain-containing protein [Coriobacteriia bacterium]|nr:RICIN domain-containing protein [Coriobacteriia bacterium]
MLYVQKKILFMVISAIIVSVFSFSAAFAVTDSSLSNDNIKNQDKSTKKSPDTAVNQLDKNIMNDIPAGTYYISVSYSLRKVVNVNGNSSANCANINLWDAQMSNAQMWTLSYDSDGYVTFTNPFGKVMDVDGAKLQNFTNVQQYSSNKSLAQKWIISKENNGYKITSALSNKEKGNFCLDVNAKSTANGTNIQIIGDNGTDAQRFQFYLCNSQKIEGEKY